MRKEKRGQIWVETVLYVLIGLALIGLTLAIVMPRVNQAKDGILMEQSIESLNAFDEKVREVVDRGQGNTRAIPQFGIRRGSLKISPINDTITLVIDELSAPYSEPGVQIKIGNILMTTQELGKTSTTSLELNYKGVANITYLGRENQDWEFAATPSPYTFIIKNLGKNDLSDFNEPFIIDIKEGPVGQI